MRTLSCLWLLPVGLLAVAAPAFAQSEQMDIVTRIDGEATDNVVDKYFNAENCADPASILYDLTLVNAGGVSQAHLWAGTQNAGCEQVSNRSDQLDICRAIAGNPQTVGDNATMVDLSLQALVDTGIVDCENTAREGQTYWIYSFRNEDPGGSDVSNDGFGVAPFIVDVTPPDELNITSAPEQTGSTFSVGWDRPVDSQAIAQYRLYASATDDADAAFAGGVQATADQNATSVSVSASALGLAAGDEIYLFVSAVDQAAVTIGNGNEGPLSVSTKGIAASTAGFCDDPEVDCSGCSVGPLFSAGGQPAAGLQLFGFILAFVAAWRLRR